MAEAWVYVLRCRDGSLYTGWSTDVQRRLSRHRAGTASRYTASRLPVELALALPLADRRAAMRAEALIKRLPRSKKLELVGALTAPLVQTDEETLMLIRRLADTAAMHSKLIPDTPQRGGEAVAEPVVMERDEMRRALERVSQEMLQRVADSFETARQRSATS